MYAGVDGRGGERRPEDEHRVTRSREQRTGGPFPQTVLEAWLPPPRPRGNPEIFPLTKPVFPSLFPRTLCRHLRAGIASDALRSVSAPSGRSPRRLPRPNSTGRRFPSHKTVFFSFFSLKYQAEQTVPLLLIITWSQEIPGTLPRQRFNATRPPFTRTAGSAGWDLARGSYDPGQEERGATVERLLGGAGPAGPGPSGGPVMTQE